MFFSFLAVFCPHNMSELCKKHYDVLQRGVQSLYLSPKFSDISIKCNDSVVPAHRAILQCFLTKINDEKELDWSRFSSSTGLAILHYIYTADLPDNSQDQILLLELMKAAGELNLAELVVITELALVQMTNRNNCISMYQAAAGAHAKELENNAKLLISENWKSFQLDDFKVG